MIHPKYWLKHARVKRALIDYPLYDVPHRRAERTMSEAEAQDNFDYFIRVKSERMAFFQEWLSSNFETKASVGGDGVRAVSCWIDEYGGGLIGDELESQSIFSSYQPRWVDRYAGYNVIVDIAIFLGEFLLAKRPRLYWKMQRGHEQDPKPNESVNYLRPCIGGMPKNWSCNVMTTSYFIITQGITVT